MPSSPEYFKGLPSPLLSSLLLPSELSLAASSLLLLLSELSSDPSSELSSSPLSLLSIAGAATGGATGAATGAATAQEETSRRSDHDKNVRPVLSVWWEWVFRGEGRSLSRCRVPKEKKQSRPWAGGDVCISRVHRRVVGLSLRLRLFHCSPRWLYLVFCVY